MENNNYHNKRVIRDNEIGIIQWWRFKKLHLFFNCEKGVIEELTNISNVKILPNEEWQKLYEERNIREGNKREQMYGKLHENFLKIQDFMTTQKTGKWSKEFCRSVSGMKATCEIYKEQTNNGLVTTGITGESAYNEDIAIKHHLREDGAYRITVRQMFEEELTDNEVKDIIDEWRKLPTIWQTRMNCEEMDNLLNTTA
jgi:hypothetical protein